MFERSSFCDIRRTRRLCNTHAEAYETVKILMTAFRGI